MPRANYNISLPEELARAVDSAAKRELRSRSELVREALRVYLLPAYSPTPREQRAIEKGRAQIRRGEYINLNDFIASMGRPSRKGRAKAARPHASPRTGTARRSA